VDFAFGSCGRGLVLTGGFLTFDVVKYSGGTQRYRCRGLVFPARTGNGAGAGALGVGFGLIERACRGSSTLFRGYESHPALAPMI